MSPSKHRDRQEREVLRAATPAGDARAGDDVKRASPSGTHRAAGGPLMVGDSAVMSAVWARLRRAAASSRPMLIVGPTGAGKEVVARAAHALGRHPEAPLLDLNCGAITESLVDSQLFGHEKGAFTGADRRNPGYFAAVGSGTLFLDEIAELPLTAQARLLRVLETGRFRPVGTTAEGVFEGRIVAATHADLEERVRQGRFRDDLFQRLDVLTVRVPALDEHREDIPALVAHFLADQDRPLCFTTQSIDALMQRSWPGNVRQLRNLIDRLAVFAERDEITPGVLDEVGGVGVVSADEGLRRAARAVLTAPHANKLDAIEEALVEVAMTLTGGNKSEAARRLGVHRKVIERRLNRWSGEVSASET